MKSMTHGDMPTREGFDQAWETNEIGSTYRIRNDRRVGSVDFSQDELWDELNRTLVRASKIDNRDEADTLMDFVSCVLWTLGFEWI